MKAGTLINAAVLIALVLLCAQQLSITKKLDTLLADQAVAEKHRQTMTARMTALELPPRPSAPPPPYESSAIRPRRQPFSMPASIPAAYNSVRAWGHEQACGAPDTMQAGDYPTAWTSKLPDGGPEWLKLDYSNQVQLAEIRVRQTCNPGAISKVAAVLTNGEEVVVWEGVEDPAPAPIETAFAVTGNVLARSVKVYLDTTRVPGWNEIDAVQIVGRDGSRQWASGSSASSNYGDR